jgi:hypothetical protein
VFACHCVRVGVLYLTMECAGIRDVQANHAASHIVCVFLCVGVCVCVCVCVTVCACAESENGVWASAPFRLTTLRAT